MAKGWVGDHFSLSIDMSVRAVAGDNIEASAFQVALDTLTEGITNTLNKNGLNTITADINWGNKVIKKLGVPTSIRDSSRSQDLLQQFPVFLVDAANASATISATAAMGLVAYTTGMAFEVMVGRARPSVSADAVWLDTGASSGLITNVTGGALYQGQLVSGHIYRVTYNGSAFRLQAEVKGTSAGRGLLRIATTTEVKAKTATQRVVTPYTLGELVGTTASAGILILATDAQASAGSLASQAITPSTLNHFVSTRIATTAETQTGTLTNHFPSVRNMRYMGPITALARLTIDTSVSGSARNLNFAEAYVNASPYLSVDLGNDRIKNISAVNLLCRVAASLPVQRTSSFGSGTIITTWIRQGGATMGSVLKNKLWVNSTGGAVAGQAGMHIQITRVFTIAAGAVVDAKITAATNVTIEAGGTFEVMVVSKV